ncbi:MAG: carboxylating nicotinate-nucleotide diphosphorylase [Verrucomicrobia bacterium]|nr:carboxylating nicotinate-nucleotide diphosphorylase [Verrucomicrobiota bacterium]
MSSLSAKVIRNAVQAALVEDVGGGDATTLATIPETASAAARVVAREPLVVAGLPLAEAAFRLVAPAVRLRRQARDGQALRAGDTLLRVEGPAGALLTAERVALNFLQRLSGVATLTAAFVRAVAGTRAQILDTRKTTPGWRLLEKYAVRCGGGGNHRLGLFDGVLIKDNHLSVLAGTAPNPIAAAVARARARYPKLEIEVEADTLEQVDQALAAGADGILLDNMPPDVMRAAVRRAGGRARLEASGGITLSTVRACAEAGVDCISVGALTHSARAVDIALDFQAA